MHTHKKKGFSRPNFAFLSSKRCSTKKKSMTKKKSKRKDEGGNIKQEITTNHETDTTITIKRRR